MQIISPFPGIEIGKLDFYLERKSLGSNTDKFTYGFAYESDVKIFFDSLDQTFEIQYSIGNTDTFFPTICIINANVQISEQKRKK